MTYQNLEKDQLRKFNRVLGDGAEIYFAWIDGDDRYVFQKETTDRKYGTIRVSGEDLTNGNFEYMCNKNLSRFD